MLLNGMYVYEEYRNQGYGAELVKTAVEHGRKIGIKLVSSDLSSYFTQRMFAKLGFQTIFSKQYKDNLQTYQRMEEKMRNLHKSYDIVIKILDWVTNF